MKTILLTFVVCFVTFYGSKQATGQNGDITTDSLALVEFYQQTSGENWYRSIGWLSENPLYTWFGVRVRNGRVTALMLPANNLKGNLPDAITSLLLLDTIDLSSNRSLKGTIPDSIGKLQHLVSINFHYDSLSGEIPISIKTLSKLQRIQMDMNRLSGKIPEEIYELDLLEYIDLGGNYLSGEISASIYKLVKLQYLNLSGNDLIGVIPSNLVILDSLKYLNLGANELSGPIPSWLSKMYSLREIRLRGNNFDSMGVLPPTKISYCDVSRNALVFSDLEPNISIPDFQYEHQDSIEIDVLRKDDSVMLRVYPGGAATQYVWYKDTVKLLGDENSITIPVSGPLSSYRCVMNNEELPKTWLYTYPIRDTVLSVNTVSQSEVGLFINNSIVANGILSFRTQLAKGGNFQISIVNPIGKILFSKSEIGRSDAEFDSILDVEFLSKGLYLLCIKYEGAFQSEKFIIH